MRYTVILRQESDGGYVANGAGIARLRISRGHA